MKLAILFLLVVLARAETNRQKYSDVKRKNSQSSLSRNFRLSRVPSLSDVLEIYDYSFMSLVWPKLRNGIHLSVGPSCWENMSIFYKDFMEGKQWAYGVVDASGKYNSGFFHGNRAWVGSIRQCMTLDGKYNQKRRIPQKNKGEGYMGYSYTFTSREEYYGNSTTEDLHMPSSKEEDPTDIKPEPSSEPPFRLAYNTLSVTMNVTKPITFKPQEITIGLCVPKSCTSNDIQAIIDFSIMVNDNLKSNRTITRVIKINKIRQIQDSYHVVDDAVAMTLIIFTIFLIALCMFATAVDLEYIKWNPKSCRAVTFDLQKSNENLESQLESLKRNNLNYNRKFKTETLAALKENAFDLDTVTINNINNYNNINLVTVKKMKQSNEHPPKITLDVIAMEENTNSCRRCGKYRRQCPNPRHNLPNLPACPRMQQLTPTPLKIQKPSFCKRLLTCFSVSYSWKRLCNTNVVNKELSAIHGLKIMATFWMIYLHIDLIVSYVADNGVDIFDGKTYNNTFHFGTLAFDTLFYVSGILSCHHYFYLKSRYTVKELVSFGGSCGHALQLICFVSNRAVRLLPPYAFVIFINGVISRVLKTTSPLLLPENDFETCDRNWWKNLLYINTFYATNERCMSSSWYLSVDSQFHLAGTVVLVWSGGRGALAAGALLVLGAIAGDATAANGDYQALVHPLDSFSAYNLMIDRPLSRVAPYFIGLFTGWLIYKLDGILMVRKLTSYSLWTLSASLLTVVLSSGLWWCLSPEWSEVSIHVVWTLSLLWPTLLLTTQWNDWSRHIVDRGVCAALSRLSYSLILVHGVVARYTLLSMDTPLHITTGTMWCYFAGITSLSLLFSLILSLLIETPCCSLLRTISDCANK